MTGRRTRICIAVGDAALRDLIHSALSGVARDLVDAASLDDAALRRQDDEALLVIVGSQVGASHLTCYALADMRSREPLVPIWLCVSHRDPLLRRLSELARAGADRVIAMDDLCVASSLRDLAAAALKHVLPASLGLAVNVSIGSRGAAIELWCARSGYVPLRESDIAVHFGCDRSTILRNVKKEGWISVEHLIRTSRLIHVAAALNETNLTVTAVARSLCFGSPESLHVLVKRVTELSPLELRFRGALPLILRLWKQRE